MRLAVAMISLVAISASAGPIPYTVPAESGLEVSKDNDGMPYVEFSGVLQVRAEFFVECSARCPSVILRLAEEDARRVPHFVEDEVAQLPTMILIKDDYDAALKLVGEDGIQRLESGTLEVLAGEAELSLEGYFATYECDRPAYIGTIATVDRLIASPAESSEPINNGC